MGATLCIYDLDRGTRIAELEPRTAQWQHVRNDPGGLDIEIDLDNRHATPDILTGGRRLLALDVDDSIVQLAHLRTVALAGDNALRLGGPGWLEWYDHRRFVNAGTAYTATDSLTIARDLIDDAHTTEPAAWPAPTHAGRDTTGTNRDLTIKRGASRLDELEKLAATADGGGFDYLPEASWVNNAPARTITWLHRTHRRREWSLSDGYTARLSAWAHDADGYATRALIIGESNTYGSADLTSPTAVTWDTVEDVDTADAAFLNGAAADLVGTSTPIISHTWETHAGAHLTTAARPGDTCHAEALDRGPLVHIDDTYRIEAIGWQWEADALTATLDLAGLDTHPFVPVLGPTRRPRHNDRRARRRIRSIISVLFPAV